MVFEDDYDNDAENPSFIASHGDRQGEKDMEADELAQTRR